MVCFSMKLAPLNSCKLLLFYIVFEGGKVLR